MTHLRRIHSTAVRTAPEEAGKMSLLNSVVAIATLALLLYYVMQINIVTASTWRLQDARDRLAAVREERDALVARLAKLDDRTVLQELAEASGLVPTQSVVYLVEDNAVAAAR